ncbi:MAG TPA: 4Fe-4S dicluster domain-containing protein, partial [Ignavibacteriaceae bacterium]|nr:4Fe-4S dicluster domain-containing protein [Ignavibacteriaceae bacterium]
MEVLIEKILLYAFVLILAAGIVVVYLFKHRKNSRKITTKIEKAKEFGFYEPVSLHPVIDPEICLGSGACVRACPEKDILGLVNGKAKTINASRCVGHGACFHDCPVQAITLCIGTEKRGVD